MAGSHSTLHSDDGTPLTLKEGVILDQEGRPLTQESPKAQASGFKVISFGQLSWPVAVLALAGIAIFIPLLIMGALLFLAIILIRGIFRALL